MTIAVEGKEQHYFGLVFELAYYIHAHKEVAFFVAEDALDGLATVIGRQEKNRRPAEGLRGFLKWGERARPIRKTTGLNELQTLQWLVYRHSEVWERQTERAEGLYLPTEEDMVVRYLEHLVRITLRRGSFYVTLAVGSLLRQFSRRETRLFYDILTQSDSARMKDTNYIGKQRLELLGEVSHRFGDMVGITDGASGEKQFVAQPTTPHIATIVKESLRHFAPWNTACVIEPGFDVTDVPRLFYPGDGGADEDLIEMNRIHTALDPVCFARFVEGLSAYVHSLPDGDRDKGCDFGAQDARLAVPLFSNFPGGTTRGDRFRPPKLTKEDYVRLQRMLDARARRRKVFKPQLLQVYVDDVLAYSFDPRKGSRVTHQVSAGAGVIEVRGQDEAGELCLATLILGEGQSVEASFEGSIIHSKGQKVSVRLTPLQATRGGAESALLQVTIGSSGLKGYAQEVAWKTGLIGSEQSTVLKPAPSVTRGGIAWWGKAAIATSLIVLAAVLFWWQLLSGPTKPKEKATEQVKESWGDWPADGNLPAPSITPSSPPTGPSKTPQNAVPLIARAAWSGNPEDALISIQVEPTRGGTQMIDLSRREAKVFLSLPRYDSGGQIYSSYRLSLRSVGARLWRQTLRAPKVSLTGYAHILGLSLFGRRLPPPGPYDLEVEGFVQGRWQSLGRVTFNTKE